MQSLALGGTMSHTKVCWGPPSWKEKDLGVLTVTKLNINQQCALVAKQVHGILGCIRQSIASRSRKVILPLCSSLLRPHLEHCVQFWASQYKRDMDIPESIQQWACRRLNSPSSLSLSSYMRCSSPLTIFVVHRWMAQ